MFGARLHGHGLVARGVERAADSIDGLQSVTAQRIGEHAQGDFYIPLATTEGTLVASYNRGMRLLSAAGGVQVTVVDDRMQRGPVFEFADAHKARGFGDWIREHFDEIRAAAGGTTRVGRLIVIDQDAVGRCAI